MERQAKQTSHRLQDRPSSHSSAPQYSLSHFNHPPAAQPPVQIPFSDPFQNRDPFMPSSAHGRRGSYGATSTTTTTTTTTTSSGGNPSGAPRYSERAWSAQPPAPATPANVLGRHTPSQSTTLHQPPPTAPAAPSLSTQHPPSSAQAASLSAGSHMSYPYDSARRRSLGGPGSPPRSYAAGPLDPIAPPPPPAFASRTMPPPSPTSASTNGSFQVPAPRPPPPAASPFPGARDLSGFASRSSGPSMSISSLIGGDSSRHGNHSPRTTATAPSPTIRPIHPPSPQRARSASIRTDQSALGRPHSPAGILYAPRSDPRAPPPPSSRPPASEHHQSVPPQPPLSFAQSNVAGFRPYQSSPSSVQGEDALRNSGGHAPSRPNSQPMHQPSPVEQEMRHRQDGYDRAQYHPSFRPFSEHSSRAAAAAALPPHQSHLSERAEAMHEHSVNGHGHGPPPPPAHYRTSPHPSHTARSTPAPSGQSTGRESYNASYREEQHPGLFRPSYAPYARQQAPPQTSNGHREDLDYRAPRADTVFGRPVLRHTPPPSELGRYDNGPRAPPAHYAPYGQHPYDTHAHTHEQQAHLRREADGLHHRSLLDVSADMARKNGRSSPLPQAVQGAQPRHVGPTADPGIKNEFGRMFPGLGLGVGSNTPSGGVSANGSATPSRMSPATQAEHHDAVGPDNEIVPNGSRSSNKRGRKGHDDIVKEDGDATEGVVTPTLTQQQSKRAKTTHPAHHHHHHAHHHHHHHHGGLAEDPAVPGPSPFNTLRFPANPGAPQPAPHHHHHHHSVHAHASHHHHHTSKPAPSARQLEITVSNSAVLSGISQRPRKHLGSELYKTRLGLSPRDSTTLDGKLHFKSQMRPIPFFEDKENCTFTIRVPRGYLQSISTPRAEQTAIAGGLEEICKTRAVWGTDIYTDDSDVVAAAVHSGWLRGDFGDFNADIHDLFGQEDGESPAAATGILITEKPKTPMRSAPDADLHITVLILPPLTKYTASTQHHLRSREWGSYHDGMSFMIQSMQFIKEGKMNRFTERTAAAKHQRIAEDQRRREEAAESLMGLLRGGNNGSISVRAY